MAIPNFIKTVGNNNVTIQINLFEMANSMVGAMSAAFRKATANNLLNSNEKCFDKEVGIPDVENIKENLYIFFMKRNRKFAKELGFEVEEEKPYRSDSSYIAG